VVAGAIVAAAVLAAATVAGLLWRRRDGRLTAGRRGPVAIALSAAQLGHPLGARATLLQFSSSFCAPCRAARQLLADVARRQPGVAHIELDVDSHLALARRHDIRRTPTVFVLDGQGRLIQRGSGVPRTDGILAALAAATAEGPSAGRVSGPLAAQAAGEQPKPAHPHGSDSVHGPA
jgi:thiol-disulfide isomerase/thioredoxin